MHLTYILLQVLYILSIPTTTTSIMDTTILQWNLDSYSKKSDHLKLLIRDYKPLIICLQETQLKPENIIRLRNYEILRKDYCGGMRACGGVAIFVKNTVHYEVLNINSPIQVMAVKIHHPMKFTLCNIYIPPSQTIEKVDLLNILNQLESPYLLLGDMNAHNTAWGSNDNNQKGKILESILNQNNNLVLINQPGVPTHFNFSSQTESTIDLALCTSSLSPKLTWKRHDYLCTSDHYPITISYHTRNSNSLETKKKWLFHKANWSQFTQHVKLDFVNQNEEVYDVNQQTKQTVSEILNSANSFVPKSSGKIPPLSVPWWNKDCQTVIKNKNKSFLKYKQIPTVENWIAYKKNKALARRTIKKEKKESWIRFTNSINYKTPVKIVWERVKKIKGCWEEKQNIKYIETNQQIITDKQQMAEQIALHLAQEVNNTTTNQNHNIELIFSTDHVQTYNSALTFTELEIAIDSLKLTSTAGPDLIHNQMLSKLSKEAKQNLLTYFNFIWTKQAFPDEWRTSEVIPIPKPGKPSSKPENLRPISLTSCLCKLMEKIVSKRLEWFLEKNNLIVKDQSGGRGKRSTYDQLLLLQDEVLTSFAKNEYLLCVSCDIKHAYQSVKKSVVLSQLHEWGMKGNLPIFIQNYLTKRNFYVCLGNEKSSTYEINDSIPQGGVLSNKLFLIAINKIVNYVHPLVKKGIFIDDFIVYIRHKNIQIAYKYVQDTLRNLEHFSQKTGLEFSQEKTKAIIFTKKRKAVQVPDLIYNNKRISLVDEITYLGMKFDKKLKWMIHLKNIKNKCLSAMNIVKVLSKQTWGADRKTLTSLYKSLIRSKMEYGSMIYNSASENNLKILNPIHNQCMRYATGAFCTTPINALDIETNEPPPEVRRKIQMTNYATKVLSIQNHPCYNLLKFPKFLSLLENKKLNTTNVLLQEYYPLFKKITITDHRNVTPWEQNKIEINFRLHIFAKKNTSTQVIKTIFLSIISEYNDCVKIYTDGSKDNTYSGCAFVIPEKNVTRKFRLDPTSSIFTCELYAIFSALKLILETNHTYPQNYVIISDSQAALQAISSVGNVINPLVTNIQDLLHNILNIQIQVHFLWCPSHCGIQGNEDADQAAKLSLTEPGVPEYGNTTSTDVAASIKQTLIKRWRNSFQLTSTKISEIKQYPATWTTSNQNSRSDETTLMRLRTGHSRLTHQYLLKREDPPTCQCGELLSIKHILTECSIHTVLRNTIFPPSERTLSHMLRDSSDSVHRVLTFIHKAMIKDL